jgi:hypothetical protein
VLSRISCTALGLTLLEDEQKFKLEDVLANMSSKYIK